MYPAVLAASARQLRGAWPPRRVRPCPQEVTVTVTEAPIRGRPGAAHLTDVQTDPAGLLAG